MSDDLVKRHIEQLRLTGGDLADLCHPLADAIEALIAERDRLRKALDELVQHTHNCERELTEDLHHVDFCGESVPLTNAREALKGESHE